MSCQGCRAHVESMLTELAEVKGASVNLEQAEATLEVETPIPLPRLQELFQKEGGRYSVHSHDSEMPDPEPKPEPVQPENAVYYCPMHCEGEKVYPSFGDCPVCGMDLVPQASTLEEGNAAEKQLVKKFWIALVFTLPLFIIAMGDMIPGKPLFQILDEKIWSWIQFGLSLPVVY